MGSEGGREGLESSPTAYNGDVCYDSDDDDDDDDDYDDNDVGAMHVRLIVAIRAFLCGYAQVRRT